MNGYCEDSIINYDKEPIAIKNAADTVYSLVKSDDQSTFVCRVREAVNIIEECLERYGLYEVCIGFNGGKDCTAMLHLCHAVVNKKYPNHKHKLKALYIRSRLPFPEEEHFLQISCDRYNLDLIHFDGKIKDMLHQLEINHPEIKAVLMGTRHTDPYAGSLKPFAMTDPDWPQFTRVNPVLQWHYVDIWNFLRSLCIPYCSLYDRGYTSLGSMNNTHPNPVLQYVDGRGILQYKPAYELTDETKERDGRDTFNETYMK